MSQASDEDDEDDGDTVIWQLLDIDVYHGGGANIGELVLSFDDVGIYDAEDNQTCAFEFTKGAATLRDLNASTPEDEVLFTLVGDRVFAGEVDVPRLRDKDWREWDKLQLTYSGAGVWWGNYEVVALEANVDLELTTDTRKLLIAALLDGRCGSAGL
ncbi:hypothetical protein G6O69_31935 [Pseudenhygromyxa sp. WMMC2535]|uniref:hypothetical protein n=1 Tax=Pseudenhygromyxa sp. WMMC2535 TaxID=2712867 RepID=UPI0015566C08|nr:hypothetical protein [Pseudenhygromyxa sp. WMMC2535]NVB42478.1 hypothetical protein [Pseudenhygromyxa sp. WMMC2535]